MGSNNIPLNRIDLGVAGGETGAPPAPTPAPPEPPVVRQKHRPPRGNLGWDDEREANESTRRQKRNLIWRKEGLRLM